MAQKYNFIHERGDYLPLAIEEIGVSWTISIKKTVGDAESRVFMIYKNGWTRIFGYQKQYQKIVNYVFNKISKEIVDSVDYVVKYKQDTMIQTKPSSIIKLLPNSAFEVIRK